MMIASMRPAVIDREEIVFFVGYEIHGQHFILVSVSKAVSVENQHAGLTGFHIHNFLIGELQHSLLCYQSSIGHILCQVGIYLLDEPPVIRIIKAGKTVEVENHDFSAAAVFQKASQVIKHIFQLYKCSDKAMVDVEVTKRIGDEPQIKIPDPMSQLFSDVKALASGEWPVRR